MIQIQYKNMNFFHDSIIFSDFNKNELSPNINILYENSYLLARYVSPKYAKGFVSYEKQGGYRGHFPPKRALLLILLRIVKLNNGSTATFLQY